MATQSTPDGDHAAKISLGDLVAQAAFKEAFNEALDAAPVEVITDLADALGGLEDGDSRIEQLREGRGALVTDKELLVIARRLPGIPSPRSNSSEAAVSSAESSASPPPSWGWAQAREEKSGEARPHKWVRLKQAAPLSLAIVVSLSAGMLATAALGGVFGSSEGSIDGEAMALIATDHISAGRSALNEGQFGQARTAFEAAERHAEAWRDQSRNNPDAIYHHAQTAFWLGEIQR